MESSKSRAFLNKRDIFTSQRAAALVFWEESSALNPFLDHPCLETPGVTHRARKSPSSLASSQSPSHSHTSNQLFSPPAPKHSIHRFDPAFPLPEEPFHHQEPSQNPSSRINHHLPGSPITLYIEGRKGQMWGPRGELSLLCQPLAALYTIYYLLFQTTTWAKSY